MEGELAALRSESAAREAQVSKDATRQVEAVHEQQQEVAQQMVAELHKLKQQVIPGRGEMHHKC